MTDQVTETIPETVTQKIETTFEDFMSGGVKEVSSLINDKLCAAFASILQEVAGTDLVKNLAPEANFRPQVASLGSFLAIQAFSIFISMIHSGADGSKLTKETVLNTIGEIAQNVLKTFTD
jgi:hypothetical protein